MSLRSLSRDAAHLGQRLPHGRQRWIDDRRLWDIVEADDREIVGDTQAAHDRAEGHLVVGCEDRRRWVGQRQQGTRPNEIHLGMQCSDLRLLDRPPALR
jgi:hypothetical protein